MPKTILIKGAVRQNNQAAARVAQQIAVQMYDQTAAIFDAATLNRDLSRQVIPPSIVIAVSDGKSRNFNADRVVDMDRHAKHPRGAAVVFLLRSAVQACA